MAKKPLWRRLKYKNIAFALAVMLLVILAIGKGCSKSSDSDNKDASDKNNISSQTTPSTSKKPAVSSTTTKEDEKEKEPEISYSTENLGKEYKYVSLNNEKNIIKGDLILINGDYAYKGGEPADMVSSYDYRHNDADEKIMSIKDANVVANKIVLESVNRMLSDFYKEKGIRDVMLVSGYRTEEYQKQLYEKDLEKTGLEYSTFVEKPGHSEHHSGYALDFQLDKENYPFFSGEGEYSWVNENCYKYGFIVRYPSGKSSITGIDGETWHFRYVGVPHAQLIYNSELCYEEYILSIKQYSRENPLYVDIKENGDRYAVYYVAAETEGDSTNVDIPLHDDGSGYVYSISGNNCDGYIVTVNITAGKVSAD